MAAIFKLPYLENINKNSAYSIAIHSCDDRFMTMRNSKPMAQKASTENLRKLFILHFLDVSA